MTKAASAPARKYRVVRSVDFRPAEFALARRYADIAHAVHAMGEGLVVADDGEIAAFHERHLRIVEHRLGTGDAAHLKGMMSTVTTQRHPETFYEAKRAVAETTFRGFDGPAVNKYAREIVEALGWSAPAPDPITGSKRVVKVYAVEIPASDLPDEIRARIKTHRGVYGTVTVGHMVAGSQRQASVHARPSRVSAEDARRYLGAISEVDPVDYRYRLAADNPGQIVFTEGSVEFGEPMLLPVRPAEEG